MDKESELGTRNENEGSEGRTTRTGIWANRWSEKAIRGRWGKRGYPGPASKFG